MYVFQLSASIAVAAVTGWSMIYRCCGGLWFVSVPFVGTFRAQVGLVVVLAEVVLLGLAYVSLYSASRIAKVAIRRVTSICSLSLAHVSLLAAAVAAAVAVVAAGGVPEAVALPSEAWAWAVAEAHVRGLQLPGVLGSHHRVVGYGVWQAASRLLGEANVLAWTRPRNVPQLLSAAEASAVADLILNKRREHFVHTDTQVRVYGRLSCTLQVYK